MGQMCGADAAPTSRAPSRTLGETSTELNARIHELESRIVKADYDTRKWLALAEREPSAKAHALRSLQLKKQYQLQCERLRGLQFNVEHARLQHEQAEMASMTAQALQAGTTSLRQHLALTSVEQVEQLREQWQELSEEMGEAQQALAAGVSVDSFSEQELEAEWQMLQQCPTLTEGNGLTPWAACPGSAEALSNSSPFGQRLAAVRRFFEDIQV